MSTEYVFVMVLKVKRELHIVEKNQTFDYVN